MTLDRQDRLFLLSSPACIRSRFWPVIRGATFGPMTASSLSPRTLLALLALCGCASAPAPEPAPAPVAAAPVVTAPVDTTTRQAPAVDTAPPVPAPAPAPVRQAPLHSIVP